MKKIVLKKNNNPVLTANVIGATGLVGKQLVKQLLRNPAFEKVRAFVRSDMAIEHPKLEQHLTDFNDESTWEKNLQGDVLFSALGTTLKKAGSKEKQYETDVTFNLNFAKRAKENGIKTYILVSSVGANANSSIFYSRIKGELDEKADKLDFNKLIILRPSALSGDREETRWMEKLSIPVTKLITRFILKKYRPIEAATVAKAMINAAVNPSIQKKIWTADEIFPLAGEESTSTE